MGYAGYVPQKTAPDKPTDLQTALYQVGTGPACCALRTGASHPAAGVQVKQMETLDTLEKLVANVSKAPTELKFRKLRLSNAKIAETVVKAPGALAALELMGWEVQTQEDCLVLPITRQLTYAHVRHTTLAARSALHCCRHSQAAWSKQLVWLTMDVHSAQHSGSQSDLCTH